MESGDGTESFEFGVVGLRPGGLGPPYDDTPDVTRLGVATGIREPVMLRETEVIPLILLGVGLLARPIPPYDPCPVYPKVFRAGVERLFLGEWSTLVETFHRGFSA